MNQLQLSQAQSPRESNQENEEIQQVTHTRNRSALSVLTNIQIFVAIFQIMLILFNSYIAFNLSYKIAILYVTILNFLQIIRVGIQHNKQIIFDYFLDLKNNFNVVQEFFGDYYQQHIMYILIKIKGCFIYFLEDENFPIQYPALVLFFFTISWFCTTLYLYFRVKSEQNLLSIIFVFARSLFATQVVLVNLKQIEFINWDWMYIFTVIWLLLSIFCIIQIIFLFDFICKATQLMQESEPQIREQLNQSIIGSLWINLLLLCISGVPTFTMVCYCIKLTTKQDSFNSMSITLSVLYSVIFIVYTLYYRIQISQFILSIQDIRQSTLLTRNSSPHIIQLNSPSSRHQNQKNKEQLLQKLPQILIRLSSTYFLPIQQENNTFQQLQQMKSFQSLKNQDKKQTKTENENPKQSNRNSMTEINSEKDTQCFNCYQEIACAVYMPCGHGGMCVKCATEWYQEKQECLICRKPVESVVKVNSMEQNKVQIVDVLAF